MSENNEETIIRTLFKKLNYPQVKEMELNFPTIKGYSATSKVVNIKYEEENTNFPTSIFIKICIPEILKVYKHLYKNEIDILKILTKKLGKNLIFPQLHYSELDDKDFFLITESLTNGKFMNQMVGCNTEKLKNIIKQWAEVQLKFWGESETFEGTLGFEACLYQHTRTTKLDDYTYEKQINVWVEKTIELYNYYSDLIINKFDKFLNESENFEDFKKNLGKIKNKK
jgi:hypothetical protein